MARYSNNIRKLHPTGRPDGQECIKYYSLYKQVFDEKIIGYLPFARPDIRGQTIYWELADKKGNYKEYPILTTEQKREADRILAQQATKLLKATTIVHSQDEVEQKKLFNKIVLSLEVPSPSDKLVLFDRFGNIQKVILKNWGFMNEKYRIRIPFERIFQMVCQNDKPIEGNEVIFQTKDFYTKAISGENGFIYVSGIHYEMDSIIAKGKHSNKPFQKVIKLEEDITAIHKIQIECEIVVPPLPPLPPVRIISEPHSTTFIHTVSKKGKTLDNVNLTIFYDDQKEKEQTNQEGKYYFSVQNLVAPATLSFTVKAKKGIRCGKETFSYVPIPQNGYKVPLKICLWFWLLLLGLLIGGGIALWLYIISLPPSPLVPDPLPASKCWQECPTPPSKSILVLNLHPISFERAEIILRNEGYSITIIDSMTNTTDFKKELSNHSQLWIFSGKMPELDSSNLEAIECFYTCNKGIYIWGECAGDQASFEDANQIGGKILGAKMDKCYTADDIIRKEKHKDEKGLLEHPLTKGVEQLYEGHSVPAIELSSKLRPIAYGSDDILIIAAHESENNRVIFDSGFTRISKGNIDRGDSDTKQYLINAANWLEKK